jgi:hypothetical protein
LTLEKENVSSRLYTSLVLARKGLADLLGPIASAKFHVEDIEILLNIELISNFYQCLCMLLGRRTALVVGILECSGQNGH